MKEKESGVHRSQINGNGKGADVAAIADTDEDTKKGQVYERQWW